MFLLITYELTSQAKRPRGRVRNRPPHRAGDSVSCEHQRLRHPDTDPGHRTQEDDVCSISAVVDQRSSRGQP
jgi:hypothetical protein